MTLLLFNLHPVPSLRFFVAQCVEGKLSFISIGIRLNRHPKCTIGKLVHF